MTSSVFLALLLGFAGCACFYLASPNQRWRPAPLRARPACVAGGLLCLASLGAFGRAMQAVPAVFTFGAWTMLLLVTFPYLGAAISLARRGD